MTAGLVSPSTIICAKAGAVSSAWAGSRHRGAKTLPGKKEKNRSAPALMPYWYLLSLPCDRIGIFSDTPSSSTGSGPLSPRATEHLRSLFDIDDEGHGEAGRRWARKKQVLQ